MAALGNQVAMFLAKTPEGQALMDQAKAGGHMPPAVAQHIDTMKQGPGQVTQLGQAFGGMLGGGIKAPAPAPAAPAAPPTNMPVGTPQLPPPAMSPGMGGPQPGPMPGAGAAALPAVPPKPTTAFGQTMGSGPKFVSSLRRG
jgi:hypothetical protein